MLNKAHIAKLWGICTAAYGQQWTSRGDADFNNVWLTALQDLEPKEFERGLVTLSQSESPFPPSLGQFRSWCRPKQIQLSPQVRAQQAWQRVMESQKEPADPLIHQAMRAFGGWETFCRSLTYDNMPFHEKRFVGHYISLVEATHEEIEMLSSGKGKNELE